MSCNSANATCPINIVPAGAIACSNKCKLIYNFKTTGISATNHGNYLSIKPIDNGSSIIYSATTSKTSCSTSGGGENNYSIGEIQIYSPSIHTYNGKLADAEFILHFNSNTGPRNLLVCIPIIQSNNQSLSKAGSQLEKIIKYIAPLDQGDESGIIPGSSDFDLNEFIPKNAGYYSYTATVPMEPCSTSCTDLIVYDVVNQNAAINLPMLVLSTLAGAINKTSFPIKTRSQDANYAYNEKGAIYGTDTNEIYIDCQPTGSSGELLIGQPKDRLLNNINFNILDNMSQSTHKKLTDFGTGLSITIGVIVILALIVYGAKRILNSDKSGGAGEAVKGGGPKNAFLPLKRHLRH